MSDSAYYVKFLSGGVSGFVEAMVTHPLDLYKTLEQTHSGIHSQAKAFTLRSFIQNRTFREYYRGLTPRLVGVIPMRFTFWGVQESFNQLLRGHFSHPNILVLAGVAGGTAQTLIDGPIEAWKTQRMTNAGPHMRCDATSRTILKGFAPTMLRNIGFAVTLNYAIHGTTMDSVYSAPLGGLAGSLATQPLDYVKTQMQMTSPKHASAWKCFTHVLGNTGSIRTLMTGAVSRAGASMCNMSIAYYTYQCMMKFLSPEET